MVELSARNVTMAADASSVVPIIESELFAVALIASRSLRPGRS
jgi:hypothetical protein